MFEGGCFYRIYIVCRKIVKYKKFLIAFLKVVRFQKGLKINWINLFGNIATFKMASMTKNCTLSSHAAIGWAGWALAHPEFGSSVHPISTRRGRLYPPHCTTDCPPGFENLAASLLS